MSTNEADLAELHPLTNLLGTGGPLFFGFFGMTYVLGRYTAFYTFPIEFAYFSLVGLLAFILGMLTIPLQVDTES